MATNLYFQNTTSHAEQELVNSLTSEVIQIHGLDVFYIPRTLVKEDSDIVNHVIEAIYFQKTMPTFIVKLTNKYINDPVDMQKKMDIYFSDQDEPSFINDLYMPLIKDVMK